MVKMRYRSVWFIFVGFGLLSCSSLSGDAEAETGTSVSAIFDASPVPAGTVPEESIPDESSGSVAPFLPFDRTPTTETESKNPGAYISRRAMSNTSIELLWGKTDGAAEYHIHRIPWTAEVEPGPDVMTAENEIYQATDSGRFTDDTVETGTRYLYGVRALGSDGSLLDHDWHRADAVTDNVPPNQIGGLTAEISNDQVLVKWARPVENYELHAYRVLRSVDGQEPESMAVTYRLEQTSFADDQPPESGSVTYSVVAIDFHWNESPPADVNVDL